MNIDFKADAERLLYNADCESTLRLLDGFWDNHPEHQHKFYQSVCVEIANKSVTEYWEKLTTSSTEKTQTGSQWTTRDN